MSPGGERRHRVLVVGPVVLDEIRLDGSGGVVREPGGNAARVAVRLAQCGIAASILARIGVDRAGVAIAHRLAREEVDVSLLRTAPGESTQVAHLSLRSDGEWSHRRAPDPSRRYLGDLERSTLKGIPHDHDALFVAGANSLLRTDRDDLARLVDAFRGAKRTVVCGLNRFGDAESETKALSTIFDARRDLVFGNRDEMRRIAQASVLLPEDSARPGDVFDFSSSLRIVEAIPFDRFVMTCGADGVLARDGGPIERADAPAVERVSSSIGAGDVFAATYVAARANGWDVRRALEVASQSASRHVSS